MVSMHFPMTTVTSSQSTKQVKKPWLLTSTSKNNNNMTLSKFLKQFPDNATSWAQATDEVRDISRWSRETLLSVDNLDVPQECFHYFPTPEAWNRFGKNSIYRNIYLMS